MATIKLNAPSIWVSQATQTRKTISHHVNSSLVTIAALIVGNLIGIVVLLLVYMAFILT